MSVSVKQRFSGRPCGNNEFVRLGFAHKVIQVDIPRLSKAGWLRHQQNGPVPLLRLRAFALALRVGADGREARARQGEALIAVGNFNKIRCAPRFVPNRPARAF